MWYNNILETIGNTPLVRVNTITKDVKATVLAKIETTNPGNSIKDRMAVKMIEDAERDGKLKPGGTIIEGTSGNTGMGLAMAAIIKGYKCIFTTTDKQSKEKMDIRNSLFGGSGLGSIIGRKVFGKGYSATGKDSKISSSSEGLGAGASTILQEININSKVTAKNSLAMPSMARDIFLMKQNIAKLVKLQGETPTTKAGNWFSRQAARESAYESQFGKKSSANTPTKMEEKKESGGFFGLLKTLVSGISSAITTLGSVISAAVSGLGRVLASAINALSLALAPFTLAGSITFNVINPVTSSDSLTTVKPSLTFSISLFE
jgi:hypothetical protein